MTAPTVYILAGGQGRRLGGRVKPLVPVGGQAILDRQRAVCAALGATPVLVAPDPQPFAASGLEVIADRVAAGALGALYTALAHCPAPYALVLAGDLPFVTAPFLAHLCDAATGHDAAVPVVDERWHPLCAAYHRRVAPQLRAAIEAGRWRVTDAVRALDVREVAGADLRRFDPDGRLLLNVNTPEDHERANARVLS